MRGYVILVGLGLLALWAVGKIMAGRADPHDVPALEAPCDACFRIVHPSRAHIHHHEPGCGGAGPWIEPCDCDFYLCPDCCPCDIAGLLGKAG